MSCTTNRDWNNYIQQFEKKGEKHISNKHVLVAVNKKAFREKH